LNAAIALAWSAFSARTARPVMARACAGVARAM
jgi:hypothetical protein